LTKLYGTVTGLLARWEGGMAIKRIGFTFIEGAVCQQAGCGDGC
jgi:hypothetical protein